MYTRNFCMHNSEHQIFFLFCKLVLTLVDIKFVHMCIVLINFRPLPIIRLDFIIYVLRVDFIFFDYTLQKLPMMTFRVVTQ